GIGAPGGVLLGALLETLPAPDVDELVAAVGDHGRPEADQAKAVLLPLVDREASESIDERGKLTGGDIVATKLVEHAAPPFQAARAAGGGGPRRPRRRYKKLIARSGFEAPARIAPGGGLRLSRPAAPAPRTAARR